MAKEEVRDGYLGDLPEEVRIKIMTVHKMISDAANSEFKKKKYNNINTQAWAKTMLDEFLTMPTDKNHVGSVRVYKKGNTYKCMIQCTGHVTNNRNTEDEELFHGFIRNVHTGVRSKVRRKLDVTLSCESEHGEPFEGFDIWLKKDAAKVVWDKFADKTVKEIKHMDESASVLIAGMDDLPVHLQTLIENVNNCLSVYRDDNMLTEAADECPIGYTIIERARDGSYSGSIIATQPFTQENIEANTGFDSWIEAFCADEPTKNLVLQEDGCFAIEFTSEYGQKLWEYIESDNEAYTSESYELDEFDPYTESEDYNVNMSTSDAKRTLKTLSQSIINKPEVTQYSANIYANVITKNLLSSWARGYNKLTITLDYKSSGVFEFKIPSITNDFIARFIEGRESLNGFLHRTPEIKIRMSPDILTKMKNPDDAYNFFRAAVRYYDTGVNTYSTKLMSEVMKLNSDMKRLISSTKLSGIVTCPLRMLFVFDQVDISNKNTFTISLGDIKTVNQFVKNIYSRYAAPDKEKKKILDDLNEMLKSLKSSNPSQDAIKEMTEFREAVQTLYEGGFSKELDTFKDQFIQENVDTDWSRNNPNPQVKYLIEKTKVKKLKKIPADLVAYITIEAESIRDATDKMMIASYCISKIEIVEWYIELLEVGSNKYIVPHTKPYLESVRTQLLACYKKIMATPIPNPATRPIIDIQYPKGYEG